MVASRDIGTEYLEALSAAQTARHAFETNDGDRYDPCDETKKRVTADYDAAVKRLANASTALIGLGLRGA